MASKEAYDCARKHLAFIAQYLAKMASFASFECIEFGWFILL